MPALFVCRVTGSAIRGTLVAAMIPIEQTHLSREIHQQPAVIQRLLDAERSAVESLAAAIRERDISHVVLAARGTSDNAGRYAQYALGSINRLTVALATPSLFTIYGTPPRMQAALVLGISQSGKSPDIVSVLAEAHRQGALTAAISNNPNSDLARQAEHVIHLDAGQEQAVAATKTYTAELSAIALLCAVLAGDGDRLADLERIPAAIEETLKIEDVVALRAERYRYMRHCVVVGRGYNYATAFELALKLKELTYSVAEPYSSADFLHGPLALIDEGFPVIAVAPSGEMGPGMRDFIQTVRDHGAEVIAISDDPACLERATTALPLTAAVPEWLSPLTAIVPGQLLAMRLAYTRGYDPDQPRSIRKVTETR